MSPTHGDCELSIASEHYAKAAVRVAEAEALLVNVVDPAEAQVKATIALTHAIIADTVDRGYTAERLIHALGELTSAIRVSGS